MVRLLFFLLLSSFVWAKLQIVGKISNRSCETLKVIQQDNLLVVGEGDQKGKSIKLYNISSPTKPQFLSEISLPLYPSDIALLKDGKHIAVVAQAFNEDYTSFQSKVLIINITTPTKPSIISSLTLDMPAYYCDIFEDILVISSNDSEINYNHPTSKLYIIDLAKPKTPLLLLSEEINSTVWEILLLKDTSLKQMAKVLGFLNSEKGLYIFYIQDSGDMQLILMQYSFSIGDFYSIAIPYYTFSKNNGLKMTQAFFSGLLYGEEETMQGGFFWMIDTTNSASPLSVILDSDYLNEPILEIKLSKDNHYAYLFSLFNKIYTVDITKFRSYARQQNFTTFFIEEESLHPSVKYITKIVDVPKKEIVIDTLTLQGSDFIYQSDLSTDKRYFYTAANDGLYIIDTDSRDNDTSTKINSFLLSKTFKKTGTFTRYDFPGVDSAFDWIFVTPSNKVYQLQGNPPTQDNVFGWKRVYVSPTITSSSWNMIYIGDFDHDGNTKFDWVLYKNRNSTDKIYKLDGITSEGTFKYKRIHNLKAIFQGNSVLFTEE